MLREPVTSLRAGPAPRRHGMSTRSKLLLLATAASLLASGPRPGAAAPKPALCTAGRFAVQGAPLLGPGGDVVVLANRTMPVATLSAARKAQLHAITADDALVVMVNPDDDSISIFRTADDTRLSKVTTGDEPSAVVLSADGKTAWVANRAAATVVKVSGIDTASPTVSDPIDVGSEPTGLALTPTGAHLFVAEFAEGRVSRIDTAAMTVTGTIDSPQNPRGIGVTNDGDADDADEHVVVPEFFGEPNANGEGKDTGRTGRVRIYKVSDLSPEPPITFDPIDSGVAKGGNPANGTVMTSPNQLWGVAFRDDRIYLPSVSASPEGPPRFDNNVFAVVWVGDLTGRQPVTTGAGTTNLTRAVLDSFTAPPARFVVGDIVDLDFVAGTNVSYVVSRAAAAGRTRARTVRSAARDGRRACPVIRTA